MKCYDYKNGGTVPQITSPDWKEQHARNICEEHNPACAKYKFFTVFKDPVSKCRFDLVTKSGNLIGIIEYDSHWRQYVLSPQPHTVWSAGCLADVNTFFEKLRNEEKYKTERKKQCQTTTK